MFWDVLILELYKFIVKITSVYIYCNCYFNKKERYKGFMFVYVCLCFFYIYMHEQFVKVFPLLVEVPHNETVR